jgi:putative ABC transport system permease protein
MAMTTRERIGEYAILKTLGFGGWHITALIFGESLVITIMGCLLGVAATFPGTKIISKELGTYFPVFNIGRETILLNFVAAFTIAFVAAIIPTRRAIKIRIADGLRRIG